MVKRKSSWYEYIIFVLFTILFKRKEERRFDTTLDFARRNIFFSSVVLVEVYSSIIKFFTFFKKILKFTFISVIMKIYITTPLRASTFNFLIDMIQ